MTAPLTESQFNTLLKLSAPNEDGERLLTRRGPLASAQVLRRLGLAEYIGPGYWNGERWRITDAGRAALAKECNP